MEVHSFEFRKLITKERDNYGIYVAYMCNIGDITMENSNMKMKMAAEKITRINYLSNVYQFWKRQDCDWKATGARTSLERFGYQMVFPYLSIYIVALGAAKTQLGLGTSIALLMAG